LLLLKLVLLERAGLDNRPLLEAQREATVPAVTALETRLRQSIGTEHIFVRYRLETTRSVISFIDGLLEERQPVDTAARRGSEPRRAPCCRQRERVSGAPTLSRP